MLILIAKVLVGFAGLYLISFGLTALLAPSRVARFLQGFARSARVHYLELVVRATLGAALLMSAPHLLFPALMAGLGWVLLITTAGLLAIPWTWHRRFARWSVPQAIQYLTPVGICAVGLGGLLLVAATGIAA